MPTSSGRCFCAFCRSIRVVYRKKHVSALDIVLTGLASALLSWLIWQDFDPRGLMFFVVGVGCAEIFVLLRRRFSIACPRCGFDPIVYKKNRANALTRVREHRVRRQDDPMSAFLPPLPVYKQRNAKAGPGQP